MLNSQTTLGFIAALLLVAITLMMVQINQRSHTIGESLHEAVQEIKK